MLASLKKNSVIKFLYRLPFLIKAYHFCLAFLGSLLYRFPSKNIFLIGVTGTKGKSTTVEIINAILKLADKKTAVLSSVHSAIGESCEKNKTENSMPGRFSIQRFLRKAVGAGCGYAIVEVTSQGVDLHRHRFLNWGMGLITNLAPEHIEHHGSFEKYREAKFSFLNYVASRGAPIFLNSDDPGSNFFTQKISGEKVFLFSVADEAVREIFRRTIGDSIDKDSNLLFEEFNRENVAAAVVIAKYIGIDGDIIKSAIKNFKGLAGRMEVVQEEPFKVVIDYAHTPDSLKKVYSTLGRSEFMNSSAKLICVLGSAGGGRDKWKRSVMGEVAGEFCDQIILTNEDPYDENPSEILSDIKSGISREGESVPRVFEILDRREAMKKAVSLAGAGDTVVITGKGSEAFIHIKDGRKIPWSDRGVMEEVLGGISN
jgi:UDP-N-acetylmuramoyl-L-alanyl-D-glutamate--2,6-diaminopimelate ligase